MAHHTSDEAHALVDQHEARSSSASASLTTSPGTTDYDDDGDGEDDQIYDQQSPQRPSTRSLSRLAGKRSSSTHSPSRSLDPILVPKSSARTRTSKRAEHPNSKGVSEASLENFSPESSTPKNMAFLHSKESSAFQKSNSLSGHQPPDDPGDISKYGADHAPGKKWQTVVTRVIWGFAMVGGFVGLMTLGHVYLIVLIFIIQVSVFREISNLFEVGYKASAREHVKKQVSAVHSSHPSFSLAAKERKRLRDVENNRWSKVMSWYFFCVVNYFLYGESIIYYFKHLVFIDAYLLPFARHHRFISLLLYLIGFLAFVAKLDRGHLRRQFGLFSWIHMSLLLIVASSQFMVNNILEGLIWFWVPASLVIMNDIAAYVFGMLFGKHQLIKLSPKKTVEGFVGGYFATMIFGVLWGSLFMGWNYMICPVRDLGMTAFSDVQCVPNNAFIWRALDLPETLVRLLSAVWSVPPTRIWWTPFQLHCLVLGTFAGLVAPFGGFFASGFKRAFNIKDFADTIPGHGGLTDRFDCQFIMGLFTYFYYTSMVREHHVTVGSVLEVIASSLNSSEQLTLYHDLRKSLLAQGYELTID